MTSAMLVAGWVVGVVLFGVGAYSAVVYAMAGWDRYRAAGIWTGRGIRERTPRRSRTVDGVPGVYVQWCLVVPVYVGQSKDMGRRLDEHAESRMVSWFTHWSAVQAAPSELNSLERSLIRAYPWCRALGFNRTGGGS